MLCFLFVIAPVCLTVIIRRRAAGLPTGMPIAMLAIAGSAAVFSAIALGRSLEVVHEEFPADRATIIAAGVAEGLNCEAFVTLALLPLSVVAFAADRSRMRRRNGEPAAAPKSGD